MASESKFCSLYLLHRSRGTLGVSAKPEGVMIYFGISPKGTPGPWISTFGPTCLERFSVMWPPRLATRTSSHSKTRRKIPFGILQATVHISGMVNSYEPSMAVPMRELPGLAVFQALQNAVSTWLPPGTRVTVWIGKLIFLLLS